jgi:hypothetical protein
MIEVKYEQMQALQVVETTVQISYISELDWS